MRTATAAFLLLFLMLSGNVWLLDFTRTAAASDLPDCCRDGICPHHHAPAPTTNPNDCSCKARQPELLTSMFAAPAVMPTVSFSYVSWSTALAARSTAARADFDRTPPSPPPKS